MVGELKVLALMSLVPSPTNPRKSFDAGKLQELAASLGKQGMLQPIVVRPMPFGKVPAERTLDLFDEFWEIVAGERRYRAAQVAGLKDVPCVVTAMNDAEVVEAQVVENSHRDDVSPLEEADAFAMLLDMPAYRESTDPVGDLATKIGQSRSQVYARLKLRSLGAEGRELVANGSMNASVALRIARLQPKDQARACKALYGAGGEVTDKGALDWIRGNLLLRVADFKFDPTDATLLPIAGPCTACPKNTAVDPTAFGGESGGKAGLCTDPGCFKTKMTAQEDRVFAALVEEHGEAFRISSTYSTPRRKDTYTRDMFEVVTRGSYGAKPAVDVEPS